jgi:molybdenum cofactor cytidylyltransferase
MPNAVFAVVLAAGSAKRFGTTKQLEPFGGKPLVRRAADLACEMCGDHTVLVVGHDWRAVTAAARDESGYLVHNERHADGFGTSISLAVRCVAHAASAILLLLADQPLITPQHLASLCDAWSGADDEIIATAFAGTSGPPVLFPRATFAELARLEGDQGARHLLRDNRYRTRTVIFEPAATDVDTQDDLRQLN